jgi:hypothetical protein
MFRLTHVVLIGLFVLAVAYWWRSLAAREVALRVARRHCEQLGLQFLDDSVALRGLWLKRDEQGQRCVWRSYVFDFTATGEERYQGRIMMLADRVDGIFLPPHRFDDQRDRTVH